jgi:Capsule polysaccharide biosynthesis protein
MSANSLTKKILGALPLTAELDWALRHRDSRLNSRFRLKVLEEQMPRLLEEMTPYADMPITNRKVFFFASWHYWIVHAALSGLVLRGLGYDVTLGYLPFSDYDQPVNRFDLRLQDLYARNILENLRPYLKPVSFLDLKPASALPEALSKAVERVTVFDTQYTLQREDVSGSEPIYRLRAERNQAAARLALAYFEKKRPDVVVVPNGMIQEYAAVYETARFLGIPAVTYEFGEHNRRTWLGQDRLVIHHITDELWAARKERKLNPGQRRELEEFLAGRQGLTTGEDFAHLWQKTSREGGEKIRIALGLDDRPVILLPTNVLGDSATLGLTVFSKSMTEWLQRVISFLAGRPEVQVVVRIHPAETWTVGPSVAEIIRQVLPELPPHIHMISSTEKVNTYDLMDIADLALVYTTTAGLEMAARGIPVLISGRAHYRKKGFTLEADSWEEYFARLDAALKDLPACHLTPEQVEQAWNYAYSFFKEYPRPFPWHLEKIGPDLEKASLAYVLSPAGRAEFEATFRQMAGEPITWQR